ncbi:MAG: hypothetical protein JNM13_11360 [Hyphomicrobiaceae bacterium]|nr:hypothetical protein [Hyphomicrobiaceae bacterium]
MTRTSNAELEQALHGLEATGSSFALRYTSMASVRREYVRQIHAMSQEIRAAVASGEMTARAGATLANEQRNEILAMSRRRDMDLGRAFARQLKEKGLSLDEVILRAMRKLKMEGRAFATLTDQEQHLVYMQVIESAGGSRPSVTARIPRLRWIGRSLWIASLAIGAYNIGSSDNPWWQAGREATNIGGGIGGGMAAGAAVGIWGGPIGVAVGVVVGGVLGALLADRAYVEAAGTSDPTVRAFVGRFTALFTGTDEDAMARALVNEHSNDLGFVERVFQALDSDYTTDADDVVLEYVGLIAKRPDLAARVRARPSLITLMRDLLGSGWTTTEERQAMAFLGRH